MINVVLDAFGGDNAPVEIIKGTIKAINENSDIHIVLTGNESVISEELKKYKYNANQISILDAKEIITNDDAPTLAIRQKKDSSLVKALDEVKDNDEVVGIISAGSTGAVLTGAFMKLGRLKGILRPALCPILPTKKGGMMCICDCGANMDCKPEYIEQFALMGSAYLKTMGIENPRVALANVGTEDHKGDTKTKECFELLSKNANINFVGNMEARDVLSGDYDLVVCDGFIGNIMLKSTEGAIKNFLSVMKASIKSRFSSKIGALFMRKTFKDIGVKFDYNKYGGAVLLGCKKLVVKAHGSSKADSICACINQIVSMHKGDLINSIATDLNIVGEEENE